MSFFFFFNDTATTEIYTLSLHDALPIFIDATLEIDEQQEQVREIVEKALAPYKPKRGSHAKREDRKSTRLNSSHSQISYAVFCLKKKNMSAITVESLWRRGSSPTTRPAC